MDQSYFGIVSILLSGFLFIWAWKCFFKGQINGALLLVVFGGIVLRVFCSSDFYLHDWDEKFHALVAKNLLDNPLKPTLYANPLLEYDFKNWSGNHIWVHKQPLPLWTIAGSLALFGFNEFAVRLPSIILSSIAIVLVFKIATHFFNSKTGFFAAFLVAINGLVIELTAGRVATDHVDIFFFFFILLGIYFSVKHVEKPGFTYCVLIGLSLGLAILCKWLPAIIILPIWFVMAYYSRRFKWKDLLTSILIICGIACLIAAPWQWYIYENFPIEAEWEASFNWKHFTSVLDGREGSPFYFLHQIRINYGEFIYLPIIWFFVKAFKSPRETKYWVFLIWTIIPLIIFSIAQTKMQGYILFTAPAYFVMTAEFFWWLLERKPIVKKKWLSILIWLLFLGLPIRYGLERIKPFDERERRPQWVLDLKSIKIESQKETILFNYPKPIEAMFYTDMTVYRKLPKLFQIEVLQKKGYAILVYNSGNLPPEIIDAEGLSIVDLKNRIGE